MRIVYIFIRIRLYVCWQRNDQIRLLDFRDLCHLFVQNHPTKQQTKLPEQQNKLKTLKKIYIKSVLYLHTIKSNVFDMKT